ncbi:M17 family metallopeptidase [Aestuariibacter salexigens]|uniref:M17 family metallopeptidase n=1 Tax=Aestuariibacter salexigens TaxID=226010 RepID=UPI00040F9F62|nr:leucyl aminopeptidase family protein [Aestuariibacter salexigens]
MSYPIPTHYASLDVALQDDAWDALIVISDSDTGIHPQLDTLFADYQAVDARFNQHTLLLAAPSLSCKRIIHAPCGDLSNDVDDVRRIYDAARDGADMAKQAGATRILIMTSVNNSDDAYMYADEVAYLGACQALWQPLEAREVIGEEKTEPVVAIGLISERNVDTDWLSALEAGRRVARDLCGTEPERMAPPGFADYCATAFAGSAVSVEIIEDNQTILNDYPLLHAVARASVPVKRHNARVIKLEYCGEGEVERTLFFAGKGITFDTGGADLKVGGHMAGMSRDKGGAAAVAGLMKTLAEYQPKGIRVVAMLGAVRNSIGSEAFVPDEIITGHAGQRVRIGNTDAEGRLVLADLLSHLREEAVNAVNPEIFSVATLTGHAAIAFGPYTALVENGPALSRDTATHLVAAGEKWADPAEQSRSRREDFDFVKPRTQADDVLSSNNAPSVGTVRGHQFPMAFLAIASGLDQHGNNSDKPLPYTHVDIAGSGVEKGDWQHGKPTAAPVVAFAARYFLR